MTHKRQQVRHRIEDIVNGTASFAGRVATNRSRPTNASELPQAVVYTVTETAEVASMALDLSRHLLVSIEIRAAAVGRLDDVLDDYAEEVEAAMAADRSLGGLSTISALTSTAIGLDGEGEARQAVLTLTYDVRYETGPAGQ